jgi:lipid A 3-O-deacylase
MKILAAVCVFLFAASISAAQDSASVKLQKGSWELGGIIGGGTGLGKSSGTQFLFAGGRGGRIFTKEHLPGWLKGNFEWAVEVMPLYEVFAGPTREVSKSQSIYGGSFKPVIWEWNFTSNRKIVPYTAIAGGILFTTRNIPPGNTSAVNFTPQFDFGTHIFLKPRRAVLLGGAIVHHSNASLGRENPGYNTSFFWTIGYSWFKR